MSKDLRAMSPEAFEFCLPMLSISQLKDLIEQIYEFKWTYGKHIKEDEMCDWERKETKITRELIRRGYYNPKRRPQEVADFHKWKRDMQKKRIF